MIENLDNQAESIDNEGYLKTEHFDVLRTENLAADFKDVLKNLGEDTSREGLLQTPLRVAKALQFCTQGYNIDAHQIIEGAIFNERCSEPVIVRNIEFYSLCEHHILPFFGNVHIGYIPDGKITGLSKLARVVDVYARRLQVQERLTEQIAQCINETLSPKGVAVVVEAKHLCMMMRGVEKQNSLTITSSFLGLYSEQKNKSDFLNFIRI